MSENAQSRRPSYPEAEAAHPWLGALIDAYHQIDLGVQEAVRREVAQDRSLACVKGCAACCRSHKGIPVYPLEIMGLYWYCVEQLQEPTRERLRQRLAQDEGRIGCPFLLDDACSVHPMRPMACRQFNVFGRACAEGEDAFHTRRGDVMTPIRRFADDAFDRLLPHYGIKKKAERRAAIRDGRVHALARDMLTIDWFRLGQRMTRADREPSRNG
jgi:Fe-S-cluster containining protein